MLSTLLLGLAITVSPSDSLAVPPTEPVAIPVDTLRVIYASSASQPLEMPMMEVQARRIVREGGADRVELGRSLLASRDGGSVADLGALLPSTHLTVNSRGEALFMVRGSSERHLRVQLDGIPLTVPWDERADLSLLPLVAVGKVVARRGVGSAIDPVNGLAGLVSMETEALRSDGSRTRAGLWAGEGNAWGSELSHVERSHGWQTLIAIEQRRRDATIVPAEFVASFNQDPTRRARSNSALQQTAALARLRRDFGSRGSAHLLLQLSDATKQVAPETHVGDSARFWRLPLVQRALLGGGLDVALGEEEQWRVESVASLDIFRQDIHAFADAQYDVRTAFEEDRDRTAFGRMTLERSWNERWRTRLQGSLRNARHVERTTETPTDLEYVQNLGQIGGEVSFAPHSRWELRSGAAYEFAATPETGDKPDRGTDGEISLHSAVELKLGRNGEAHLVLSRRPRFASLRELFSGSLQRFAVNPELRPEVQDAVELGADWSGRKWAASVNGFAQQLDGAIERIRLADGRRQRVNLDEVRHLGVEAGLTLTPVRGLTVDAQSTWLRSRARDDEGSFTRRVEDRPDWLLTTAVAYTHPAGWNLRSEWIGVGPRESLNDASSNPAYPYLELDADLRWNLRLSYTRFGLDSWYHSSEWFVRLDNVLDTITYSQTGLPESGRNLRLGWSVELGH